MLTASRPKFLILNSLALLLITLAAPVAALAQSQPIFPVYSFTDLGTQRIMATGDFNNDGQIDYATIAPDTTTSTSTLTILLNQGTGVTPIAKTMALNLKVTSLLAIDFNKDKNIDLLATCTSGSNTGIAVLLGNGDGTFQPPSFYPVAQIGDVVAVDLNGDGYPDIAAISGSSTSSTNSLDVMVNKGSAAPGTFGAAAPYQIPTYPGVLGTYGLAAGDFNGDGKQDVVVLGNSSASGIFIGNGDGTLQASSKYVPGGYFECCAIGVDLNHDGIADIAYVGSNGNTLTLGLNIVYGSTSGTFTQGTTVPISLPYNSPMKLVSLGANTAGGIDLAAVGDKTIILHGDSNGNFVVSSTYAASGIPFPMANSTGRTDLLLDLAGSSSGTAHNQITHLISNGDGTFNGAPVTYPVGSYGFAAADFNNDGITDVISAPTATPINFGALALGIGRGNGTFVQSNILGGMPASFLAAADFNGDGNQDVAALASYNGINGPATSAWVFLGNGDGTFQAKSPSGQPLVTNIQITNASGVLAADFNGDGKADLIGSFYNPAYQTSPPLQQQGLVFLSGKGDGTFGTPVQILNETGTIAKPSPLLLAADLNNDHKLDLLWNGSVYLGNGDGTFQKPIATPGPELAIGDLNGDGIPDAVIGNAIYAGKGDGSFASSPFYTATLPAGAVVAAANFSDVNADGHPDLLLQYQLSGAATNTYVAVYFGNGSGNFTPDPNTYYVGSIPSGVSTSAAVGYMARLNNNAPQQSNGRALDYLAWTNDGATVLLNQSNPVPNKPSSLPTKSTVTANLNTVAPTQPDTFTAQITGLSPTGTVTFTSGSTTLGISPVDSNGRATLAAAFSATGTYTVTATYSGDSNNQPSSATAAPITVAKAATNLVLSSSAYSAQFPVGATEQVSFYVSVGGYAPTGTITFSVTGGATIGNTLIVNDASTLNYAFTTPGSYTVTASYSGDAANLPSTSNATTVAVVPQDFTLSAPGNYASIKAGQAVGALLTVDATQYGFGPPISFSCSGLTTGERCTFTPPTVTLQNREYAEGTTQLIIFTTGPTTNTNLRRMVVPLQGAAWAGLLCLLAFPRRTRRLRHLLLKRSLLAISLAIVLLHVTACSSGSGGSQSGITPSGTQTITITAAGPSGSPSHILTIQLNIQ